MTITALYGVTVVWAAAYHEPWRDEVVPLSIARQAHSLAELAAPLRFEGHPILWYLVLWTLWSVIGQTWVLKAASLGSAIGATWLLSRSPLPWWLFGLATFSFFPLYQYAVVSRGYSLEMLLLFAFCTLYARRRAHPVLLAVVLALLANTEAFGLIMAVAAGAMMAIDVIMRGDRRAVDHGTSRFSSAASPRMLAASAVYAAGLLLATSTAFPDATARGTGVRQLDLAAIADGVGRAILQPVAHSSGMAVVPLPSLWIWGAFVYLLPTPPLLAFAALSLVGFEALFNLVHGPGAAWHIGNVFLVLVATLWLDHAEASTAWTMPAGLARARTWLGRLLVAGFALVLVDHVVLAARHVATDVQHDYSSNRRLAELLRTDPALADAVVMGEPDPRLWSLPYYAGNRIYLARESLFRDWGIFAPPRRVAYDLGALLGAARQVRENYGTCAVVIALGFDVQQPGIHESFAGTRFAETFEITAEQRDAFLTATRPLAPLRGPTMTDERYDVFVLR